MRSLVVPFLLLVVFAGILAIIATCSRPAVPPLFPRFAGVASPPLSVADELKSFRLAEADLKIECAASEPMIEAPIAAQFDQRGRLWVVEMITYMPDIEGTGELERRNRISILEDTNHDGIFDKTTIFMDDLVLPRGVAPCFDGALVIEPPNLLFCRDTNGDGKADERTILATGFAGLESPEHAGNGLLFGLDGWIHLSQHKEEFRLSLDADSKKLRIEKRPVPARIGQWGLTQDSLGRLYYTPNSNPLIVDLFPKHWEPLNPNIAEPRGLGANIAPSDCWPIHPTPGANRGYQPDTLRADGTLARVTAACGPIILTDSLLGETCNGNAFLCDAVGNLVQRLILTESDSLKATNAYKKKEFLASTDERFRPVNTVEGPDGSLYILDMYRGVIQHKTFETNYVKEQYKKRNLETPLNMGRIWRISRQDSKPFSPPDLASASSLDRVANLDAPNTWLRMQSLRLLHEQSSLESACIARLRSLSTDSGSICAGAALFLLDAKHQFTDRDFTSRTDSPFVRRALAQLAVEHPEMLEGRKILLDWARNLPDRSLAPFVAAGLANHGDIDELFRFLATNDDSAARTAALCFLRNKETQILTASLKHADAEKLRPFIVDLFNCSLSASKEAREAGLAAVALAPASIRRDMLNRLHSFLRVGSESPRTLDLSSEPATFLSLELQGGDAADKVRAISERLAWPGKPVKVSPLRELTDAEQSRFGRGSFVYENCRSCHQPDGKGAPGQAPSLAGSAYVNGPPDRLIKILLHGLQGTYEVNGQKYEGAMPVPPGVGSNEDIASVLTYIRRSFGNTAEPVDQQTVDKIRKQNLKRYKSWTRPELDRSR